MATSFGSTNWQTSCWSYQLLASTSNSFSSWKYFCYTNWFNSIAFQLFLAHLCFHFGIFEFKSAPLALPFRWIQSNFAIRHAIHYLVFFIYQFWPIFLVIIYHFSWLLFGWASSWRLTYLLQMFYWLSISLKISSRNYVYPFLFDNCAFNWQLPRKL